MVKTGIITVRRKLCFPLVAKWRQQAEIIRRTTAASTNPKVRFRYIFRNWLVIERSIDPPEVYLPQTSPGFPQKSMNRAVTAILNRVIPDHSDIIRNLDAMLSKCGTNAYRHTVIGTGNCFRKFLAVPKASVPPFGYRSYTNNLRGKCFRQEPEDRALPCSPYSHADAQSNEYEFHVHLRKRYLYNDAPRSSDRSRRRIGVQ